MAPSDNGEIEKQRYIATKADFARLEEQVKGLDRAIAVRLAGIETLQDERSKALRDVFDAVREAVNKAELAQHNVNMASNEFRKSLEDLTKNQASRPELESLDKRMQAMERGMAGGQGRSGGFEAFKSNLFAILALLIALGSLYLASQKSAQIDANTRSIQQQQK